MPKLGPTVAGWGGAVEPSEAAAGDPAGAVEKFEPTAGLEGDAWPPRPDDAAVRLAVGVAAQAVIANSTTSVAARTGPHARPRRSHLMTAKRCIP